MRPSRVSALLSAVVLAAGLGAPVASPAAASPAAGPAAPMKRWAPVATATITPGVQMYTDGAQCTGNFVFTDKRSRVYVGYAAHCAGLGESDDTDGCTTKSLPLRTPVRFATGGNLVSDGSTLGAGRLAYSSWFTMQRLGTKDWETCAYNDFALVRVRTRDISKVNPTVPFWGGPTGLSKSGTSFGDRVFTWGHSGLRPGTALSPRDGYSVGYDGNWSHEVYTLTPGVPGDSGSGFLDADGRAFGVLSTVQIAPLAGANGVGDLRRELRFARRHSGIRGLRLVRGTEPFSSAR
ncbi:hypothetical protein [Nocardioides sp.]|uniref:hypothetical protein n=1 Tax=Nocardioides sp. TaxID=35761 RepID=UPI0035682AB1